ncbi:MAG: hypothetical protein WC421_02910 [Elusimicrobiales bacterium]
MQKTLALLCCLLAITACGKSPLQAVLDKQDISPAVTPLDMKERDVNEIYAVVPFDVSPAQARATLFSLMKRLPNPDADKFAVVLVAEDFNGFQLGIADYRDGILRIETIPTDDWIVNYNKTRKGISLLSHGADPKSKEWMGLKTVVDFPEIQRPNSETFRKWRAVDDTYWQYSAKSPMGTTDVKKKAVVASMLGLQATEIDDILGIISRYYCPSSFHENGETIKVK